MCKEKTERKEPVEEPEKVRSESLNRGRRKHWTEARERGGLKATGIESAK